MDYKHFSKAVESLINDVKVDPYKLVFHMLKMFFNDSS